MTRRFALLSAAALVVLAGAGWFGLHSCSREQEAAATSTAFDPAADGRVSYLLAKCSKNQNYDVDTADPLPILMETLQHGQRDPLRRAREELSSYGPEAIQAVSRLIDANLNAPDNAGNLRNAVDVLARTDDPAAREPLLRLLPNREQSIGVLAAEALRKHGKREDFDMVWALFEVVTPELRSKLLPTFHAIDPLRTERLYLDWMEGGANEDLWEFLILDLAAATDPSVVERCCALWPKLSPRYQYAIAAACARSGDERALTLLREALRSSNPALRGFAIESVGRAGLVRELVTRLHDDPDPTLRARVLTFLAKPEHANEYLSDLRAALGDSAEEVSAGAAVELCKLGDAGAIEHCLQLLDDPSPGSLEIALRALREPMTRDPALARRAFERLRARSESEAKLPIEARTAVLSSIAQVPVEDAALLLYDLALRQRGQVGDMPASRWLVLQAANTGEVGQRLLASRFATEKDGRRRLDLIEGMALRNDDFARQALIDLLDGDALTPYETLYAADRITRMGPVGVVAPLLKRVTLRVTQGDVRLAMQCLLWGNYPGPR